jgi:hypothetical protein
MILWVLKIWNKIVWSIILIGLDWSFIFKFEYKTLQFTSKEITMNFSGD